MHRDLFGQNWRSRELNLLRDRVVVFNSLRDVRGLGIEDPLNAFILGVVSFAIFDAFLNFLVDKHYRVEVFAEPVAVKELFNVNDPPL